MKNILVLFLLACSIVGASELYPPNTDHSFDGLASWSQPRLASGSVTPPVASAADGDIFINIATPSQTVLQIKLNNAWRDILGGGEGTPGATGPQGIQGDPGPIGATGSTGLPGTTVHNALSDLDYANSGHTGFQPVSSMSEYLLANTAASEYVSTSTFDTEHSARVASEGAIIDSLASETLNRIASLALKADLNGSATQNFSAGIYYAATGTLSFPSFSFSGDTNTGLMSPGANILDIVCNGIRAANFSQADLYVIGNVRAGNGSFGRAYVYGAADVSSTVPGFTFNGNSNTGLGRNAIGQPSMVASGTEAMRFTNVGNHLWPNITFNTPEGGIAGLFTNSSGLALPRGTVVSLVSSASAGIEPAPTSGNHHDMPIGMVYATQNLSTTTAGIGSSTWVVFTGTTYVWLDGTAATVPGGVLKTSDSTAGRAEFATTAPSATDHFTEVGHNIASGAANAVVLGIVHFN